MTSLFKLLQTTLPMSKRLNVTNVLRVQSLTTCSITKHNALFNVANYPLVYLQKRNAGHSKWQNIRHIKAANDKIKSKNTVSVLSKIKVAVLDGGGIADPKKNSILASALEEGKKKDVPKQTMLDYLKKIEKNQNSTQQYHFECKIATCNLLLIFQGTSEHPSRTKQMLANVVKRFGGTVTDKKGLASYGFDIVGTVIIDKDEIEDLSRAEDIAIECEAEEVIETEWEESPVYKFVCDPDTLKKVAGKVRKHEVKVREEFVDYIPNTMALLTPEVEVMLGKLFDKLDTVDNLDKIYDNIPVQER